MSSHGEGGPLQAGKETPPETESASTLIRTSSLHEVAVCCSLSPTFSKVLLSTWLSAICASELSTGGPQPENAPGLHTDTSLCLWRSGHTAVLESNTFPEIWLSHQKGSSHRLDCVSLVLCPHQPSTFLAGSSQSVSKSVTPGMCMLHHFSPVWFSVTLWPVACQAPLSVRFSRQEYWSGWPFPPPEDLPDPGTKPSLLQLLHCTQIL